MLPEIGEAGQEKLKAARVLIVGIGGLGSPVALYLAAAGVGTLGLADADRVDPSNLQRQTIYETSDIGRSKTAAAGDRLADINPHVRTICYPEKFTAENALRILADYDLIVDGTDQFAAHYLINDACVMADKPLVYGNVHRFEGQAGVVLPKRGPCYRCLYPAPPPPELAPSCAEAGVLNAVPGLVGMIQATEVLKIILGIGTPLHDRILRIDGLNAGFREIKATRDPDCAVCGSHPSITTLVDMSAPVCVAPSEISADELKQVIKSQSSFVLLDVRNPPEYAAGHIEGAKLIPLPVLADRLDELNASDEIVVYCQSGTRSAQATTLLQSSGFANIRHLKGGIAAFAA